jgi:hypothetical protein
MRQEKARTCQECVMKGKVFVLVIAVIGLAALAAILPSIDPAVANCGSRC